MKKKKQINKKTKLNELLEYCPEAAEILFKEGMMCVGCPVAMQETLEQGCKAHGIDVNKILKEINKKISKKK